MNKLELIAMMRELVHEEVRSVFKSKAVQTAIKEIIKEEVRKEVDLLLTEMEQTQPNQEVIEESETKESVKLAAMVERGELPPRKVLKDRSREPEKVGEIRIVKNDKLNKALNQTLMDLRTGVATVPSAMNAGPMGMSPQMLNESAVGEDGWETLPVDTTSAGARMFGAMRPRPEAPGESSGKSVAAMLPSVDVRGNPMAVNPQALPDHLKRALTRNYKKLLDKVDGKA